MICPKCQNVMKTVNKDGVHIDQCEGCGGIFLDRGELEQIASAETAFYAQAAPPPYRPAGPPAAGYQQVPPPMPQAMPPAGYRDSPRPYRGGHGDSPRPYRGGGYGGYGDSPRPYGHGHRRRRRGSFLEGLFD